MAKSTLTNKVLQLVAKEVGEYFTGVQIVQLLEDFGYKREQINYPNTKWMTILDALKLLRDTSEEPDIDVAQLIDVFLDPLNHEPKPENATELALSLRRLLSYCKFTVTADVDEKFIVTAPSEQTDWNDVGRFLDEQQTNEQKSVIPEQKDVLYQLRDYHQTYIDILEIFCENPKKPRSEHNDAYTKLTKKIQGLIAKLDLKYNGIDFYVPFSEDLYSAELEWNGSGDIYDFRLGPKLSWDAMRPKLYKTHSDITKLINFAEQESDMFDDEKMLESIATLVADHRAKKAKVPKNKDNVKKLHVTYRHEDGSKDEGFYIEKKGDDFYYKGDYLPLTKNSDYYKVFSGLFAKLPKGGTIKYKDLFAEVRSRIKKVKAKSDEELKTFILNKLTNTQNGFLRQAKIPATQDNGKPLIAVERGHGIVFNNKTG